jgi:DNA-binding transcriptional LysR family regulator
MKLEHLRTLVAVAEQRSFAAAGTAVGLSPSAVSLHVKALEDRLGAQLLDRGQRPPVLNERGQALVEQARRMLALADEMAGLARDDALAGAIAVAAVPTALGSVLPPALADLRRQHPQLRIQVRSGLSAELAAAVSAGQVDAALVTAPGRPVSGLRLRPVVQEPLVVIAPADAPQDDDAGLIAAHPFVWFNRQTWAGRQIERLLAERGLEVGEEMEVDSLEGIAALVQSGLGVSVVPQRAAGPALPAGLKAVPFGRPQATRTLAMLERRASPKARLTEALYTALRNIVA